MKLIAKQDFSWAHRGVQIEEFKKGQEIDTDDQDLIKVSTEQGWASKTRKGGVQSPSPGDGAPSGGGDGDPPSGSGDADGTDPGDAHPT